MRSLFPLAIVAGFVAAAASSAAELKIVPASTKIEFLGTKKGGSHTGGFKDVSGKVAVNGDEIAGVTVEIATDSIHSDDAKLTQHLKAPDFFDVRNHPKASFTSTKIAASKGAAATHEITGDLTLHGVKKSITVPVKVSKSADGVLIEGKFNLPREDFNMKYGKGMINNDVQVTLSIKAGK